MTKRTKLFAWLAVVTAIVVASALSTRANLVVRSNVAGGGGTDPLTVANLLFAYETPISGATNNADLPSGNWPDSSGNGYTLHDDSPPQYKTDVAGTTDAVDFATRTLTSGGADNSTYPRTFVVLLKVDSTAGNRDIIGSSGGGGICWRINGSTGYLNVDKQANAVIGTGTVAVTTGSWHVVSLALTSTTWAFRIDGAAAGSGSHSESLTASKTVWLGCDQSDFNFFDGQMIGVYGYSRELSSAEIDSIGVNLLARVGL